MKDWVDHIIGGGRKYGEVITEFSKSSGVSRLTLDMLYRGGKLRRWDKAKDIEYATKGEVTAESLMEVREEERTEREEGG